MLKAALFDFDGTLVDTTEMIHQSMRHAASSVLGRDDIPRETLLANVGQPLPRQMELIDAEKAELLLEAYRRHHEENHEISVTPVHLELTDTAGLEELGAWDVGGLLEDGPG